MGSSPVAFSCVCPHPCFFFLNSQAFKILVSCADFLPSFPCNHSHAASNPLVQALYQFLCICQFEVIHPSSSHLIQSDFSCLNPHPVAASCYLPDFVLEFLDALGMYSEPSFSFVNVKTVQTAGNLGKMLKQLAKLDLLICDEWGYIPLDRQGAQLLFQVVADCYEKRSIIITTNLEFSKWNGIFYDEKFTSAIIDRLIHHSHLLVFGGQGYRLTHSTIR